MEAQREIREGDHVNLLDDDCDGVVLEIDRHQAKVDIEWDARWYPLARMALRQSTGEAK